MADRSLRITVDTQELGIAEKTYLFDQHDKLGWFRFDEHPVTEDLKDAPEIKFEKGEKTPSQRQRGIIYRLWEQEKTTQDFELFYASTMNKINDWLKGKLDTPV